MDSNVESKNSEDVVLEKRPGNTPEKNLACAVVLQALIDCRALMKSGGLSGVKGSEPYLSLAYPTNSMRMWCELADIDPDAMAQRVREAMKSKHSAVAMINRTFGKGSRGGLDD